MNDISANNKRIAKNTIFLYVRMFIVLAITLYTSRVILEVLGVEDYGIYNVVAGFVSLFGFMNSTLSSSMQRFYNFEMGKNGEEGLNKVYSTGLFIQSIIAIALLVLMEGIGIWYINNVMVIPPERLFAANAVFQSVVVSMMFLIMQIPYSGIIMAFERMDYFALISIVDVVLKLLIVIALPYFQSDNLIVYAILLSIISLIDFLCYFIYSKINFGFLRFERNRDNNMMKSFLSFSGWNLIGTFIYSLKGQGVNLILNLFGGPVVNAARGIAFQVHSAVGNFSQNITTAFKPQVVSSYASSDYERVKFLFYTQTKVCFSLILILVIPLIIETDFVLGLWLGKNVPELTNIFTKLVLFDMIIGVLNQPVVQIAFATGDIRRFQIATSLVNILILPVCYFLLKIGLDVTSVFYATIVFSLINQTVCVIEAGRLVEIKPRLYLRTIALPGLFCVILSFSPIFLVTRLMADGWLRLIVILMVDIIITSSIVLFFLFDKRERKMLINCIKKVQYAKS